MLKSTKMKHVTDGIAAEKKKSKKWRNWRRISERYKDDELSPNLVLWNGTVEEHGSAASAELMGRKHEVDTLCGGMMTVVLDRDREINLDVVRDLVNLAVFFPSSNMRADSSSNSRSRYREKEMIIKCLTMI
ncbi:unnamed protein product [Amoebophrya sp. A25]|nr:unnamed protein product [Amoebophrya sp. A25]|eukprot:GSA25T00027078001.1